MITTIFTEYYESKILLPASVTRLGDLLDFGLLFKACGNN